MDVLKISSDLMRFKSISPKSAGSLEYVEKLLKVWGFDCDFLEFGNNKVKNLYASFSGGNGPNVCFAGHTDVVPPGDEKEWYWTIHTFYKKWNFIGRGKWHSLLCLFSCFKEIFDSNKNNFNGSISFLLTADEEGDAILEPKPL